MEYWKVEHIMTQKIVKFHKIYNHLMFFNFLEQYKITHYNSWILFNNYVDAPLIVNCPASFKDSIHLFQFSKLSYLALLLEEDKENHLSDLKMSVFKNSFTT